MFNRVVWVISYRIDGNPQQETRRYTPEAAKSFIDGIESLGGIAVVNKTTESTQVDGKKEQLKWDQ